MKKWSLHHSSAPLLAIMGNCCCTWSAKCANYASSSTPFEGSSSRSSTASKAASSSSSSSLSGQQGQQLLMPRAAAGGLKSFSMSELRAATKNLGSYLGEGGFGCVYKGWIDDATLAPTRPGVGRMVAIKKLRKESFQGHREWLAEVSYLGELHHDNLVKLVGYCSDADSNKLLVYEYMVRGSLENHLFRRRGTTQPLSWPMRLSIALKSSSGTSSHPTSYSTQDFRAKLSDFGLARDGPTGGPEPRVVGTRGYAAPEYIATGHLSVKSDIYSYGVVLLELLTGRRALDEPRGSTLVDWAKPKLAGSKQQLIRIMDSSLGGQYSKRQAQDLAALALRCLDDEPKNRPAMADAVLPDLERLHQHNHHKSSSSSYTSSTTRAAAHNSRPQQPKS